MYPPPSIEKPLAKIFNMADREEIENTGETKVPIPAGNPMVFDLTAMERRLTASYQEFIKVEVRNALKTTSGKY